MKIRQGFVSNSSSSSFLFGLTKKNSEFYELLHFWSQTDSPGEDSLEETSKEEALEEYGKNLSMADLKGISKIYCACVSYQSSGIRPLVQFLITKKLVRQLTEED